MDAYSSLEKTINLIENNLDNQDLNISFLSKKVFVSPYHLQRIFYTLFANISEIICIFTVSTLEKSTLAL